MALFIALIAISVLAALGGFLGWIAGALLVYLGLIVSEGIVACMIIGAAIGGVGVPILALVWKE